MIKIGHCFVGKGCPPFIIAEMSGNHNQSLEHALKIVDAAAKAGVSALKIQTYTADSMTLDISEREFYINNPEAPWKDMSLHELYRQAYTPWEWHEPIFKRAKDLGIIPFSTPFDEKGVEFLERLNVDCYKIASFENTDLPLIKLVASTGKPIIISTGMASLAELDDAVTTARLAGCNEIILLKCTSTYPATPKNTNILTIPHLKELFNCEVGISDHTMGIGVSVASVALGGAVIEKHLTISRAEGGVDSSFSLEPEEMRQLVIESKNAYEAMGKISYGPTEAEKNSMIYRRTLYVVEDIREGEKFTKQNVKAIRPGLGLPIKNLEIIIGKVASCSIKRGTALEWKFIK